MSEVHAPPMGACPPMGNPGFATAVDHSMMPPSYYLMLKYRNKYVDAK